MSKTLPIVLVTVAALAAAAALAADGPVAGQVVMKLEKGVSRIYGAQISPDGKLLVYMKTESRPPGEGGSSGRLYKLVLRDLASGKETPLPAAAMPSDDPVKLLLGNNIFDKDSARIVLFVPGDPNSDGVYDMDRGTLQTGVYDIFTGKVTRVGPIRNVVLPMFDGRGTGLVITAGTQDAPEGVFVVPSADGPIKALSIQGAALAAQPGGDCLAVVKFALTDGRAKPVSLVLFDAAKNVEVATLPGDPMNSETGEFPPRFTADGNTLCWTDKDASGKGRFMTRIWDVPAGKELAPVPDSLPLGAYKNGMLLGKGRKSVVFQESPTGQLLSVQAPLDRPILTRDKVLWCEKDASGAATLMMADIANLIGPPIPATPAATEPARAK